MYKIPIILLILSPLASWGQDYTFKPVTDSSKYVVFSSSDDSKLDLTTKKKEEKDFKKKKPKKKVFYGYKTRKGVAFKNKGIHSTLEVFFYLKTWEEPNTFVKDIFWFDPQKLKIIRSHKYDPNTSKLLHGPYVKKIDNEDVESGVYYKGVKHAR